MLQQPSEIGGDEEILLISKSEQKGCRMDTHGKESHSNIRNSNLIRKLTLIPEKKERDSKCKYETDGGEVEDDTLVETLDISDNEVNRITRFSRKETLLDFISIFCDGDVEKWQKE